jgi:hypothetical protein
MRIRNLFAAMILAGALVPVTAGAAQAQELCEDRGVYPIEGNDDVAVHVTACREIDEHGQAHWTISVFVRPLRVGASYSTAPSDIVIGDVPPGPINHVLCIYLGSVDEICVGPIG